MHRLKRDKIVERLAPGGAPAPSATLLVGFAAPSPREGWTRLYARPDASEFVEFAATDVLHEERISGEPATSERTAVWLARNATVVRGRGTALEAQEEFLRGELLAFGLADAIPALLTLGGWAVKHTDHSCYKQCLTGFTACRPVLCTLHGMGCQVASRAPDVCV